MILLALIVGGFIAFIYYCLVFWGAVLGIGVNKLNGSNEGQMTSGEYLDNQIGADNSSKLTQELVNNNCNCRFSYHTIEKNFYVTPVGNNNSEKIIETFKKYGVDNVKINEGGNL